MKKFAPNCFVHNDIVFISINRKGHLKKDLILAPGQLQASLIAEAHTSKLFGHDGPNKTTERLFSAWYWPGMVSDTIDFVRECETCIKNRKKSNENTAFLKPLEAPEGPLQEISTDIFGPLIAQDNSKKYVLTIVDQWS